MTQGRTGVTGAHTTAGIPRGFTSLTPHIVVAPAGRAIDFYQEVFGAVVESVTEMAGAVAHAQLNFGAGRLTLSDPLEAYELKAQAPGQAVAYSLGVYVPNVDEVVARAVKRGATLRESVTDFVSGDRFGSILDPFGVRWSVMTRVEDLSDEESAKRVEQWAAGAAQ